MGMQLVETCDTCGDHRTLPVDYTGSREFCLLWQDLVEDNGGEYWFQHNNKAVCPTCLDKICKAIDKE